MENKEIFNVCLLDSNGQPSKIFIFSNKKKIEHNLIFSEKHLNDFKQCEFIYVDQIIHSDDNIKNIKRKIIKVLKNYIDTITYEQLYLFAKTSSRYNVYDLFKNLSSNLFIP